MNSNHAEVCGSADWAAHLQTDVLPVAVTGVDLGNEMLEIGPGPGAATEWLRQRVAKLTAIEVEEQAAAALVERYAGSNVEIVTGDATNLPYPDESFDSVGTFTMLHHVPTQALQDRVLAEALRVLRPGGWLVGSDSLASDGLHHFHVEDTYNPIEPGTLLTRLRTIGFAAITVAVDHVLIWRARKDVS
jgi:ubiquinone/menaquinone biosynthesis C-methylase UbiE